ncbi:4-hydroxybenzoate polyprenyltransferase [Cellvibrio fibrivorans]|uniref:4-hydroxybenzoate octaprenyltransferase n=1 Tax=Cellvibrio fibrivorans TaxID=126350 RepID=A0ABU1V1F5_9GAMM|nr:4-hydroxybenzoate polyprenyltransferase [Cellvibrio fibrivorans]
MTNPDDVKPPAAAPKKPATKKVAPTDAGGTSTKPKTAAKPATKKAAKPAASEAAAKAPAATVTKPAQGKPVAAKITLKKATSAATTKPAVRKPKVTVPDPALIAPSVDPVGPTSPDTGDQPTTPATDWANVHAAKILKRAAKNSGKAGFIAQLKHKAGSYWRLTRMDRPIGTLLLLWPTLWSLWIAAKGVPSIKNLVIFVLGVIVMRAAGCVINDFADRKIDGKVLRTKDRPLATGAVSSREAIGLFITLCLIAFALVLFTDPLTIKLSVGGLILAFCYPFMKRHTHLPQVVLGAAFAWGIPMAYAAEAGELHQGMWLIYLSVVLWTVAYDTFYAMVDRDDDLKIGVKSTAILFGEQDRLMTGVLQIMALYSLVLVGNRFELGSFYYLGLAVAAGLFIYQQWLIRFRVREACFKAFLNNNWVGVAVFAGIIMDYSFR